MRSIAKYLFMMIILAVIAGCIYYSCKEDVQENTQSTFDSAHFNPIIDHSEIPEHTFHTYCINCDSLRITFDTETVNASVVTREALDSFMQEVNIEAKK